MGGGGAAAATAVIRSCRNDAKRAFKEPLVKLEANTIRAQQLNEFTTAAKRHHMHHEASINPG